MFLFVVLLSIILSSCINTKSIKERIIEVRIIHDYYVNNNLQGELKNASLNESKKMVEYFYNNKNISINDAKLISDNVFFRHDIFVFNDENLKSEKRIEYLDNTYYLWKFFLENETLN